MKKLFLVLLLPLLALADNLTLNEASYDAYINDAVIRSDYPDNNYLTAGYFYVSTAYKGIIEIDPHGAGMTTGYDVDNCSLYVFNDYYATGETHTASRVKRVVVMSEVTWNIYSSGNNWGTAGCAASGTDYDGTPLGTVTKSGSDEYYGFEIDQAWIDTLISREEKGYIVVWETNSGNDSYYQTEEGANAPYLSINYTASSPPDAPSIVSPANAATGIIPNVVHHQVSVTADSVQYQIDMDSGLVSVDTDSVIATTTLSLAMSENTIYYWAARGKNGAGWGAWSDTVSYTTCAEIDTNGHWVDIAIGSDDNDGGFSTPWLTISKACTTTAVMRNDTVTVRGGYYRGQGEVVPSNKTGAGYFYLIGLADEEIHAPKFHIDYTQDGIWLENINIDSTSGDDGIELQGCDSIAIRDCSISMNDHAGIYVNAQMGGGDTTVTHLYVDNCEINKNGQNPGGADNSGIVIYAAITHYINIDSCNINLNEGKGVAYARSSYVDCDYGRLTYCNIINNYESGVDIQGWENGVIGWNYISLNGQRDVEEGEWGDKGLQLWSDDANTVTSGDSIMFNIIKSSGRYDFVPTDGPFYVFHNLFKSDTMYSAVYDTLTKDRSCLMIFESSTSSGSEFKNNIFMNTIQDTSVYAGGLQDFCYQVADYNDYDNHTWDYNLFWHYSRGGSDGDSLVKIYANFAGGGAIKPLDSLQFHGWEINSVFAEPLFTAAADSDFTPAVGSPVINAGVDVGYPYSGSSPDIGPYEYTDESEGSKLIIINVINN